ncbi:MAG: nucleotidyl transferase AbiEii/AbiGii toxin family protein [Nitriliruptor sp.]|nr:MAG: nucleotidyl transferase AbiEii/AbiGii toxin family protein [Nitriliruptor sp.]
MTRPTRDTTAGRVYLDLRKKARSEARGTDELLVLYVLERFLYRLSISPYRNRFVLKGGMLLAAFNERRPTRDVDLLGLAITNDAEAVSALIGEIAAIKVDDGVTFQPEQLTTHMIREQEVYAAVRVAMPASLATAALALKVDVNVGDPVTPAPVEVTYPALLDQPFTMVGYPLATVLAEKLVTMIARGDATTRERDFADVWLLARRHPIGAGPLRDAMVATADHRDVTLVRLSKVLSTLATDRQDGWHRYITRAGLDTDVPATLAEVIADVLGFVDPLLDNALDPGAVWDPAARGWWR